MLCYDSVAFLKQPFGPVPVVTETKVSTDSWTVIPLRVRSASFFCASVAAWTMKVLQNNTVISDRQDLGSLPNWSEQRPQNYTDRGGLTGDQRSQLFPQRSKTWETSGCSAKLCAAQWGRSSASSLWHSHGAWLSFAVTSSGAVLKCKSGKSEHFICYIVHTSRYLEAKQKLQRETTSAGLFVVPPL